MSEQVPDSKEPQDTRQVEEQPSKSEATPQQKPEMRPTASEQKPEKGPTTSGQTTAKRPRKSPQRMKHGTPKRVPENSGRPQAKTRRPARKAPAKQVPKTKAPGRPSDAAPKKAKPAPRPSDTSAGKKVAHKAPEATPTSSKGKAAPRISLPHLKLSKGAIKLPSLGTLKEPSTFAKALVVLVAIYVVGIIFFWSRFLPQTTVDGRDVSWKSVSSVSHELAQAASDYELKVFDEGVTLTVDGDDIGLAFDEGVFKDSVAHPFQKLFWPIASLFARTDGAPGSVTYDDETLRDVTAAAAEQANAETQAPHNATVAFDETRGRFVGVSETQGTQVNTETLHTQVTRAVDMLQETLKLDSSVLVKPTVIESDPRFAHALESAQDFPALSIDLRLSNVVVDTIDQERIRGWLKVSDDYQIVADESAIEDWTRGDLSAKLDSVGALRTWERWDGKKVQVFDGTYGWNIDGAQLAKDIAASIDEHSETPIEVPCAQRAALYNPGGPDWGKRYIEVDLTEQIAYMYDEAGDLVWQSECVTGNESKNDGTVVGVYSIENKKSPETLVGLDNNGDGEPDYENEVEFWMPFYGGFGLHDALWRDSFNYDTYLTDGSHGCVNLPYYSAASLYELCRIGDPVVVHW